MKKLHFTYTMQINYSSLVGHCNYTIKCIPQDTKRQKIENIQMDLFPTTKYNQGLDGLKNQEIHGAIDEPHDVFRFRIEGDAITGLADYEEEEDDNQTMIFKHPHGFNVAGKAIKEFFEKIKFNEKSDPYDTALSIMQALFDAFEYVSGSTTVDTMAEDAFCQGRGVCQDYAHILIALLHLAGIPARYVTGFIIGEGASHAWVEILSGDKWYGIDPTHNRPVADDYIKIGVGRDAKDCMINRGIMHGGGAHTVEIQVSVSEL